MTGNQHEERIANLFLRGYSLDLICELGAIEGWSRHDAREVATGHDWPLDWSGRLQAPYLALEGCQTPGMPQPPLSIVEACPEKVIAVASDSESASIRFKAQAAQHAIDDLRMAMLQQEEHDLVVAHRRARSTTKLRTYTPPERPVDKINITGGQEDIGKGAFGPQRGSQGAGDPFQSREAASE